MSELMISVPSDGSFSVKSLNECRISSRSLKKSRWSALTLSIILIVGLNDKKLLVYSQASVTKRSERPTLILPPMLLRRPPTQIVGPASAATIISEIKEVEEAYREYQLHLLRYGNSS